MTETLQSVLDTILEVIAMLKEFFGKVADELGIELNKDEAAK